MENPIKWERKGTLHGNWGYVGDDTVDAKNPA